MSGQKVTALGQGPEADSVLILNAQADLARVIGLDADWL